jgi:hypothetical protein
MNIRIHISHYTKCEFDLANIYTMNQISPVNSGQGIAKGAFFVLYY